MLSFPWQFWVAIIAFALLPLGMRLVDEWLDERRFARAGLKDIRHMSWRDFEKYLAHLFRSMGYQVELTPAAGDFGVDVIAIEPNGRRIAIQAKQWKKKKVGAQEVQKTIGGAAYHNCQKVIVVTTSRYTDQAKEMARKTGVELWGLDELAKAVDRARAGTLPVQAAAASRIASAPPIRTPTTGTTVPPTSKANTLAVGTPSCPKCQGSMVKKLAVGREIWVCSQFPRCTGSRT